MEGSNSCVSQMHHPKNCQRVYPEHCSKTRRHDTRYLLNYILIIIAGVIEMDRESTIIDSKIDPKFSMARLLMDICFRYAVVLVVYYNM